MATKQYWVKVGSKVSGPFSSGQLRRLAKEGKLHRDHEVSDDQKRWFVAGGIKELTFGSQEEASTAPRKPATSSSPGTPTDVESEPHDIEQLLAGTGSLPTLKEGLLEAPRKIAIACGIWLGFGVLTTINSVAGFFACVCIGFAAHKALVNESFDFAVKGFGGTIGIAFALMLAGALFDAGLNAMRAKRESLESSAILSLAAGAALGLAMLGFAVAHFLGAQITVFRDAKVPVELARFLQQGISFTLFLGPPLLIWSGVTVRRHHSAYVEWRNGHWKDIPEDSPERITVEDRQREKQLEQQQQTVEMLSRILPLDRLPEEKRLAAVQLILGGTVIAILLGVAALVYSVQATSTLR